MALSAVVPENYLTLEDAKAARTRTTDKDRLREACQGFESLFLHIMLKTMRNSTVDNEDGFLKKSSGEKIFTDMFDQEMANIMAQHSVNGITDTLYKALEPTLAPEKSVDEILAAVAEKKQAAAKNSTTEDVNQLLDLRIGNRDKALQEK